MGFDLTNQNISDTFQNLLQRTGSNNQLYDLHGNAVTNLMINGDLIASRYITSESIINTSSGSTMFGNSSDDFHTFIGSISSSGNIHLGGKLQGTGSHNIVNLKANFVDIEGVGAGPVIRSKTDTNTYIALEDGGSDSLGFYAGGNRGIAHFRNSLHFGVVGDDFDIIMRTKNNTQPGYVFQVEGSSDNLLLSSGSDGKVGSVAIGATTSSAKLTVEGSISASGDVIFGNLSNNYVSWSNGGTFEINMDDNSSNEKVFKVAVDNSSKFSIDEDGDVYISGDLDVNGLVTDEFNMEIAAPSSTPFITMNNNVWSGDQSAYIYASGEITPGFSFGLDGNGNGGNALYKIMPSSGVTGINGFVMNRNGYIGIHKEPEPLASNNIFSVSGSIWASGSVGHITASGNITSSGLVEGLNVIGYNSLQIGKGQYGGTDTPISLIMNADEAISTFGETSYDIDGNITASGNISSSGIIYGTDYKIDNNTLAARHGSGTITLGDASDKMLVNGVNIKLDAPVTASGNISASGNITAASMSLGGANFEKHLTVQGDISASNLHLDKKLYTDYVVGDQVNFTAGSSFTSTYKFGYGYFYTPGNANVQIGSTTTNPPRKLTVEGDISGSGNTFFGSAISQSHTFTGHITASGNISASGDAIFDNISASNDVYAEDLRLDDGIVFKKSNNTWIEQVSYNDTKDHLILGHIGSKGFQFNQKYGTSIMTITASGESLTGEPRVLIAGNWNQGMPAKTLTVSGSISASHDIYVATGSGVILESPNGTQYRLKVDNSGNLSTEAV
tara:strand:- start:165 stop:2528 length:2364 start_codon:yes stop_codon:yes gene_type:complete